MAVNLSTVALTGDAMFAGEFDPERTKDYFAEVEKTSIVQQLAQKVPMGPTGVQFAHWTGDVQASWLGEGDQKPITKGDFSRKTFKPAKIATIFVASAEVVRANPLQYIETMRSKVAEAFALAFDAAVLYGTNSQFGAYVNQTSKEVSLAGGDTKAYDALNNGLSLLVNDGRKWTGTVLDSTAEPILNDARDTTGRPLFIEPEYTDINAPFRLGRVLGRPTTISDQVSKDVAGTPAYKILGFEGDFNQILWGEVGSISYDVSDQASVDVSAAQDGSQIVSLWQNNLLAVRIEAEYAALVNDPEAFVRVTNKPA